MSKSKNKTVSQVTDDNVPTKLSQRAIIVTLEKQVLTGRKIDQSANETLCQIKKADRGSIIVEKLVLPPAWISPVAKAAIECKRVFLQHSAPWEADNTRIFSLEQFEAFKVEWMQAKAAFEASWKHLIDNYDQIVADSKKNLGDAWKPEEMPSREALAGGAYTMDIKIRPVEEINEFRVHLSEEIMKELAAKIEADAKERLRRSIGDVAERAIDVVDRLAKTLEAGIEAELNGGRKRTVRTDQVAALRNLADLLPGLNPFNDPRLAEATRRIEERVALYEAGDFKTMSVEERANVASEARAIIEDLRGII